MISKSKRGSYNYEQYSPQLFNKNVSKKPLTA